MCLSPAASMPVRVPTYNLSVFDLARSQRSAKSITARFKKINHFQLCSSATNTRSSFRIFSKFLCCSKYFTLPSSLCESHVARRCTYVSSRFHLQVLNIKDLPQVKRLVCLHVGKSAVCWHHRQSARRNDWIEALRRSARTAHRL